MLQFESGRNALFQTLENKKIIKKNVGFNAKSNNTPKTCFFMKIYKNIEKNMKSPKRFACCVKRSSAEENREESLRQRRKKRAPLR